MAKHLHDPYGTHCSDCGAPLNSEYEIERRHCEEGYCDGPPSTWRSRFWSREPYPWWYRRMPIAVYMPWRNLGCLGFKLFGLYVDVFRAWRFPYVGIFVSIYKWRFYPIACLRSPRMMRREIINGWCTLWCWLQDHTGTGRFNDLVIRIAETVTPADW